MHMQINDLDFTRQNIYTGIDTHKKSWEVSIYTDVKYHKTFNQTPMPEFLYLYFEDLPFWTLSFIHGSHIVIEKSNS